MKNITDCPVNPDTSTAAVRGSGVNQFAALLGKRRVSFSRLSIALALAAVQSPSNQQASHDRAQGETK